MSHTLPVFPSKFSSVAFFILKRRVLFTVLISGFSNVVVNDSSVDFREAVCVQEGVGQKEAALGFDRRVNEFCCV